MHSLPPSVLTSHHDKPLSWAPAKHMDHSGAGSSYPQDGIWPEPPDGIWSSTTLQALIMNRKLLGNSDYSLPHNFPPFLSNSTKNTPTSQSTQDNPFLVFFKWLIIFRKASYSSIYFSPTCLSLNNLAIVIFKWTCKMGVNSFHHNIA